MRVLKITLGQFLAIHNANYNHDNVANKIVKRLEASCGYERGVVIRFDNPILGEYTDYINNLLSKEELA